MPALSSPTVDAQSAPSPAPARQRLLSFGLHRGGRGLAAGVIRWEGRGDYHHISGAWVFGDLRPHLPPRDPATGAPWRFHDADLVLLEAREGRGVVLERTLLEARDSELVDIAVLEVSADGYADAAAFDCRQLGKPYDLDSAVRGFALRTTRERRKALGAWFCSEKGVAVAERAGRPLFRDTAPFLVDPCWFARSPLLTVRLDGQGAYA